MKQPKDGKRSKKNAPRAFSTNVPLKCTVCQVETYIWKYGVNAHFVNVHAGLGVPSAMGDLTLSATEKERLLPNAFALD